MNRKQSATLLSLCLLPGILVIADSFIERTPAEKVEASELIVYGIATLEGPRIEKTEHPAKRPYTITILQTLWPTNQPTTNPIVVQHWVWPDTWENYYYSQTGVYFFVQTTTAVKQARMRYLHEQIQIDDGFFGTNAWTPLERFDDWYEPATNIAAIQQLIKASKH